MEDNEYKTNRVYLTKLFYGNYALSGTEKGWLESIAGQCPTLGGNAVFKARNMLRVIDGPSDYDDGSLCAPPSPKPLSQPAVSMLEPGKISVFPNPAGDWITVQAAGLWTDKMSLRIVDALGNYPVQKTTADSSAGNWQINVPVSALPAGVFVIQLYHEERIIGSKKFVKIQ